MVPMTNTEEFLSEKLKYEKKSIGIHVDEVRMPSGRIEERLWINFPPVCVIVPFVNEREVLLVQQYRHAIKEITYEFPAGKKNLEESIEITALRELEEETGYTGNIKHVYNFRPSPHYSDEVLSIYIAIDLKLLNQSIDTDEIQNIKKISLSEVFQMIENGEIIDGKTITSLLYLKHKNLITENGLKR